MRTILRYLVIVIVCLAAYYLGKNYVRQLKDAKKQVDEEKAEEESQKEDKE